MRVLALALLIGLTAAAWSGALIGEGLALPGGRLTGLGWGPLVALACASLLGGAADRGMWRAARLVGATLAVLASTPLGAAAWIALALLPDLLRRRRQRLSAGLIGLMVLAGVAPAPLGATALSLASAGLFALGHQEEEPSLLAVGGFGLVQSLAGPAASEAGAWGAAALGVVAALAPTAHGRTWALLTVTLLGMSTGDPRGLAAALLAVSALVLVQPVAPVQGLGPLTWGPGSLGFAAGWLAFTLPAVPSAPGQLALLGVLTALARAGAHAGSPIARGWPVAALSLGLGLWPAGLAQFIVPACERWVASLSGGAP
ncbi:MAG: hypothetical protein H6739_04040 [Alphaproteobacteria bacterium]|nr:hypothetical protein [Alphaproteobacteria bacterium]